MFRVSSFGALVEYGCEKKITQFSNLSASVAVGVPSGVMLKLRLFHIVFIAVTALKFRTKKNEPGLTSGGLGHRTFDSLFVCSFDSCHQFYLQNVIYFLLSDYFNIQPIQFIDCSFDHYKYCIFSVVLSSKIECHLGGGIEQNGAGLGKV